MLRIDDDGAVRTLTLDRPERLNALSPALVLDLNRALAEAARDPGVRCVVLTGAGRGFCSGFDMSQAGAEDDPVAQRWKDDPAWTSVEQIAGRLWRDAEAPLLLRRMGKPTIAAIRGPAVGAGLVLANACDIRIASETAMLRVGFVSAGRSGDPGAGFLLSQIVGPARARALFLMDPKISAAEGLDMGLVTKVVADDRLEAEAKALAAQFAEGPPLAYAAIKRNMNVVGTTSFEQAVQLEAPTSAVVSLSQDGREAARAFLEKRKPVFRGC